MLAQKTIQKVLNNKQKKSLHDKKKWLDKLAYGTEIERAIAYLLVKSALGMRSLREHSYHSVISMIQLNIYYVDEVEKLAEEYDLVDFELKGITYYKEIIDFIGNNPDQQMVEALSHIKSHLKMCKNFSERSNDEETKKNLADAVDLYQQVENVVGSESIDYLYS